MVITAIRKSFFSSEGKGENPTIKGSWEIKNRF